MIVVPTNFFANLIDGILETTNIIRGKKVNKFWIFLVAVVIGLGALFILTKPKETTTSSFNGDATKLQADDHIRGNKNAKTVLIEYGDLQCPSCGSFYSILKQLEAIHGKNVAFVFRHFPIISIHPNAFAAARAAEAAGNQGKFFEMHDKLYETQDSWGKVSSNQQKLFEEYAKELGLDMTKFRADYASEAVADRINRDVSSAKQFSVSGTPTFILNGKKIENPANKDAFDKVLTDAIASVAGADSSTKAQQ